ncbi:MAG TPA: type II methionyl aminopeptidase [Ignisphaera sp.]|uniref:Methionine aminopeptidase n=1 Tax=Ignisphaera aggregans TaxID=334771 RepID=A0A832Z133_9CREN|nr:type II methionyl aminopeptidase [Ignisphaera sp.]HIP57481.1 type II methionyl aminopeptidase [Ignisphaera aggregans]
MSEEVLEKYMKAGEIACRVRKLAHAIVKPGMRVLELVERLESEILSLGGKPAFPINVSINEIAAHFTPPPHDTSVIPENSIVKIDIGVHIDGYIADTATTIVFDPRYERLAEAANAALEHAVKMLRPGVRFSEIGRVIEATIRSYGYKPILNLCGHSIDVYTIHAGEAIPNHYDLKNVGKLRNNRAYAIEPFATDGVGLVDETSVVTIYALRYNPKKLKGLSLESQTFFNRVFRERRTLPFTPRWYITEVTNIDNILRQLSLAGLLTEYPVLVERTRGVVAQFEHTVVVYRNSIYVTTSSC